jgi:hypothetical protein
VIVENRTRWSGEDLSSLLHSGLAFYRAQHQTPVAHWINEKTVIGFSTYAARKDSTSWGAVKPDAAGNLIEIKLIRPERVKVNAIDALAGVVNSVMPRPFLAKVAHLLDRALKGAWIEADKSTRIQHPDWLSDDMSVGVLKKGSKHSPAFYAAKAAADQKVLDREHKRWICVHASRQAAIDKLVERSHATA